MKNCILLSLLFISAQLLAQTSKQQMHLNDKEYPEYQGVNVMLAWDLHRANGNSIVTYPGVAQ